MKPFFGELTIQTRSDACCYLQYQADIHEGKYNRYRCTLLSTVCADHECKHWGWCPMWDAAQKEKKELDLEFWDIRNFPIYKHKQECECEKP